MARKRRSISQQDRPARKHVETKMVLIHSLGNAGKQRSIHHIKSYMQPNMGVTAWRRAAVRSLRHFSCNEVKQITETVLNSLKCNYFIEVVVLLSRLLKV